MDILTEKHRPENMSNFVGNQQAINLTKMFFLSWNESTPKKRSILFHGPPGIGKTTLALMLAKNTGSAVLHYNASDLSKRKDMEHLLKTCKLACFNGERFRIIIVDEFDRLTKSSQRILGKVIDETLQPTILICNDISKITVDVKSKSMEVPFSMVPEYQIKKRVLQVVALEKAKITQDALQKILKYNKTVRGAINSLQDYLQTDEVSDTSRDLDLTEVQKMQRSLMGSNQRLGLPLNNLNSWLANSELDNYDIISYIDIIWERIYSTKQFDLAAAGYAMAKTARGKLCSFPSSFNAIHAAKRKIGKVNIEKHKDERISTGRRGTTSKKTIGAIPEMKDKPKSAGLEEFF